MTRMSLGVKDLFWACGEHELPKIAHKLSHKFFFGYAFQLNGQAGFGLFGRFYEKKKTSNKPNGPNA